MSLKTISPSSNSPFLSLPCTVWYKVEGKAVTGSIFSSCKISRGFANSSPLVRPSQRIKRITNGHHLSIHPLNFILLQSKRNKMQEICTLVFIPGKAVVEWLEDRCLRPEEFKEANGAVDYFSTLTQLTPVQGWRRTRQRSRGEEYILPIRLPPRTEERELIPHPPHG